MTLKTALPRARALGLAALMGSIALAAHSGFPDDGFGSEPITLTDAAEIHAEGDPHDGLRQRVAQAGTLPVIVVLKQTAIEANSRKFASTAADTAEARRSALAATQAQVLDALPLSTFSGERQKTVKRFSETPAFAVQIDAADLEVLLEHPDVEDVVEDALHAPMLNTTGAILGASPDGSFAGFTGAGQAVAVLDTGVARAHPFFAGKVVAEACFSTTYSGVSTSVCPGGVANSTAAGSGVNCDTTVIGCDHGTHVAGIVAGTNGTMHGVARDAKIIAVQVFSRLEPSSCGGSSPCARAYTSDIVRGLEYVASLSASIPVAAVNMSLGGGTYTTNCDSYPSAAAITMLRNKGIPSLVAAGNSGLTDGVAAPACVSSAIAVGATDNTDRVASFSNSSPQVSLWAPGVSVSSSVPSGGYARMSGTSMATPQVAGAWAVLKSAKPDASISDVLNALSSTGLTVTDTRNGVARPRIRVEDAAYALTGDKKPVALPAPVANAPTVVTSNAFTAAWTDTPGATGYQLDVALNSAFTSYLAGHQGVAVTGTSKSVSGLTPNTTYHYRVRATGPDGAVSPNSNVRAVTTLSPAPATVGQLTAIAITDKSFQVSWPAISGATYKVDVSTAAGFSSFVTGFKDRDVGTTPSVAVAGLKANTPYYVRVRATNAAGVGPYSATLATRTMIAAPVASAASAPTASGFTANWKSVAGASAYLLDIANDAAFADPVPGYAAKNVGTVTRVAVADLQHSRTYYYRVRAVAPAGTTGYSNVITAATKTLAAPVMGAGTGMTVSGVTLNWRASTGASGYRIDVAYDASFANALPGYTDKDVGKATRVTLTNLPHSTKLFYRVRAYIPNGVSPYSTTGTATTKTFPAPVTSAAASVTSVSFNASWRSVTGALGYRLDVAADKDFTNIVGGISNMDMGRATRYAVTGLAPNTTYYYRVQAYLANGVSPYSATATVTTKPLLTPATTAPSGMTTSSFTAKWRSVTGAESYVLEVALDAGFASRVPGYESRNVGKVTSATVTGLQPATTYYYRVRTATGQHLSAPSAAARVVTR